MVRAIGIKKELQIWNLEKNQSSSKGGFSKAVGEKTRFQRTNNPLISWE